PLAFRSARSRSASPARSTRRCSQPPCSRSPMPSLRSGSTSSVAGKRPRSASARSAEAAMADNLPLLKPGSTLGILGGGQLGRRVIRAGARLGIRCHVYSPEPDSCAFDVASEKTCAPFDDDSALTRFAKSVDLITFEFENVPAETADFLVGMRGTVLPDPTVLATTQDRLAEKNFLIDFGIGTASFADIGSAVHISVA